jgi:hypothetical protein
MVKRTLDFFQVYYKDDQLPQLYNFAKPIFNQALTPYFELPRWFQAVPPT